MNFDLGLILGRPYNLAFQLNLIRSSGYLFAWLVLSNPFINQINTPVTKKNQIIRLGIQFQKESLKCMSTTPVGARKLSKKIFFFGGGGWAVGCLHPSD